MAPSSTPLPRFLGGQTPPQPQFRLLNHKRAPQQPQVQDQAKPKPPETIQPMGQDVANFRPVLNAQGQVVAYVIAPPTPAPEAPAKPRNKSTELGKTVLGVATTGLGVAGVAFPPAVGIAGITGAVQIVDNQIGNPIATAVGTSIQAVGYVGGLVVDGVEGAVKGIGNMVEGLFGK